MGLSDVALSFILWAVGGGGLGGLFRHPKEALHDFTSTAEILVEECKP